jgi:hypothetical protein
METRIGGVETLKGENGMRCGNEPKEGERGRRHRQRQSKKTLAGEARRRG